MRTSSHNRVDDRKREREEKLNFRAPQERCSDLETRFSSAGTHPVGVNERNDISTIFTTSRCFYIVAYMILLRNYGRNFVENDQFRLVLSVSNCGLCDE